MSLYAARPPSSSFPVDQVFPSSFETRSVRLLRALPLPSPAGFRKTSVSPRRIIEAMQIGMPVLALATTEAIAAVPPDAGVLSTRVDTLVEAAQWLIDEPDAARRLGARGRQVALARYGLDRFLADWDRLLEEETCA